MEKLNNLEVLRYELDQIDNKIIKLIARRFMLIEKIAAYKKQNQIPILQPHRVEFVMRKAKILAHHYNLDESFIAMFYKIMIDYACEKEDQIYEKN